MSSSNPNRRWVVAGRWAALALFIGSLAFWLLSGPFAGLELAAADLLFRLRGPLGDESAVVIVAIDDVSFAESGLQWPWPRDYLAGIVEAIAAGNPDVIALDIMFYERSGQEADSALARALAEAGNVALIRSITTEVDSHAGYLRSQLNVLVPEIEAAAAAVGLVNVPRDQDGKVRRILAFQEFQGQLFFSWVMQVARLYLGEESFRVVSPQQAYIGATPVELQAQHLLVNFRGLPRSVPYYSAHAVAAGLVPAGQFTGKIVLVGATSESLHDSYPTPFGAEPPMPGVEINAHAIDTILEGRFIHPAGSWLRLLLAVLGSFLALWPSLRLRPLAALAAVAAGISIYLVAAALLFSFFGSILPMLAPLLAAALAFIVATSLQLYAEQRARARIRSLFDRYVSPASIDRMLADPQGYLIAEDRRHVTILFSDIRGFTSLSENLAPAEVVAVLNPYLAAMTEVIFKYEGTVDKFEGDAILAVFNAPLDVSDHPTKAVRCALEMLARLAEMQAEWTARIGRPLQIGIGVNTGYAFVGNIGSHRRLDYTVIGDAVNLASRLQDLTKQFGIPILFSKTTCEMLDAAIKTRFVAAEVVKGRIQPVEIYTVDSG
ncbi:MAG: adenylate/guanylate cyclase domain-containing protein [Anaerolineales bacterium]|nr:adenylate/guanylate cyclase domain-containing protein [Anaerolineales bacterium]